MADDKPKTGEEKKGPPAPPPSDARPPSSDVFHDTGGEKTFPPKKR